MNDVTRTPCGFTPLMTCEIVPSLPAASIACTTTSSARRPSAYSRSWSSRSRSRSAARSVSALSLSSPASSAGSKSASLRSLPAARKRFSRFMRQTLRGDRNPGAPGPLKPVMRGLRARTPGVTVQAMAAARKGLRRFASACALGFCVLACAAPAIATAASGGRAAPTARAGQQAAGPLNGQAMWIWELARTEGGDLARIVTKARQYGLSAVYVKAGDGVTAWPQFSPALVATLHAAGLRVCAWQFVYGRSPVGEANAGAAAVAHGADCLIVDAESSYEGRYLAARRYIRALRSRIGAAYPLALTSFPYVDYHPAFPYSVFLGGNGAQVNMPQVYWKDIGNTVDVALARTWMLNRVYQRPIHAIGQLYQAPTASDVLRFRTLAGAYGAIGTSWWDWQEAPARLWSVLAQPITAPSVAAVADPGWPMLTRRAKGDLVVRAQQLLRAGGRRVRVSGIYDAQTAAAVRRLQTASGIPVTGIVDAATWQTLLHLPVTAAPVVSPVAPSPAPAPTPVAPTGGSVAKVARATGGVPASADLPAVRDELSGKP